MDASTAGLAVFALLLGWLLVEIIRGSIDDPYARRAGVTWAVSLPAAGVLYGAGFAPLALIGAVVSTLALGSLAAWFLMTVPDDESEDPPQEPIAPDPSPSDDIEPEIVAVEETTEAGVEDDLALDWDEFDRLREEWEKDIPAPAVAQIAHEPVQPELAWLEALLDELAVDDAPPAVSSAPR